MKLSDKNDTSEFIEWLSQGENVVEGVKKSGLRCMGHELRKEDDDRLGFGSG